MVNINIEIPNELHKKIKLESVKNDTTLKDYIINILDKNAKK
jgi:hypothetical protein